MREKLDYHWCGNIKTIKSNGNQSICFHRVQLEKHGHIFQTFNSREKQTEAVGQSTFMYSLLEDNIEIKFK